MLYTIKQKINGLIRVDNERSEKIIKNIILSLGVKAGSIAVGLLLVPLTINYISPVNYGIWLTISSIVTWMNFFDIGLGNGLRNKLAHASAVGEQEEASIFISTTYAVLSIIAIILLVFFFIIVPHINWRQFLNVPAIVNDDLQLVILIVLCSFCVQFVLQTINTVLTATHRPAKAALISFLGQLGILIAIFTLKRMVPGSLSVLVLPLTLIPIVILVFASIYFYNSTLKNIAPRFSKIDFSYARNILNVGGVFFIIQIGAIILFQTDNIIITKVLGPAAVTEFNVAYKLFSVATMLFTIIITPYWSAFTDAYAKKDFTWMRSTMYKIRRLWFILSLVAIPAVLIASPMIYKYWVGRSVNISFLVSGSLALYVIGYTGMMLNCYFLNGIGKVRIQLYLYIVTAVINIPLAFFLGRKLGVAGVTLSNVIIFVFMEIILWIQCNKILAEKDKGIWSK